MQSNLKQNICMCKMRQLGATEGSLGSDLKRI